MASQNLCFAIPATLKDEVAAFIAAYQEHRHINCRTASLEYSADKSELVYEIVFDDLLTSNVKASYGIFHFGRLFGQRFADELLRQERKASFDLTHKKA